MRRILSLLCMVFVVELGLLTGGQLTNAAEARTKAKDVVVKGDHNFKYGTNFNKALWTLQRRYPEYLRTYSKDDDGIIDLVEDAPNVMTHYYFQGKRYVGCATAIYDVENQSEVISDYVQKFRKIYKKSPVKDDALGTYVWEDKNGNRVEMRLRMRADKAVIEISTTRGGTK